MDSYYQRGKEPALRLATGPPVPPPVEASAQEVVFKQKTNLSLVKSELVAEESHAKKARPEEIDDRQPCANCGEKWADRHLTFIREKAYCPVCAKAVAKSVKKDDENDAGKMAKWRLWAIWGFVVVLVLVVAGVLFSQLLS